MEVISKKHGISEIYTMTMAVEALKKVFTSIKHYRWCWM